jgi:uncharacterized membrane protein YfcA
VELWIIATFVAFFTKGLCGFANTLVFTSILGFGVDNVAISPVELMVGYPANFIMAIKNRGKLQKRLVLILSLLILAGSIPGALLLRDVNAGYIKMVFGAVVILIGIELFLREYGINILKESKVIMWIIGLLSGVLCGMFGVGALLAAYMSHVTKTSDEFKANLSAIFIVENTARIIIYCVLGVFTLQSLKTALILIPVMALGIGAGMLSAKRINEKVIKKLVIVLLIISGVALIIRGV